MTTNGYEIDFVVKPWNAPPLAIQVCADPSDPATLARELRALADASPETELLLVTPFLDGDMTDGGRNIRVVPAWKWFLRRQ